MKYLILGFIIFYQKFFSAFLKNLLGVQTSCRFFPTCSEYARQLILEKGAVRGGIMTAKRLFKCQPFYKLTYGGNF